MKAVVNAIIWIVMFCGMTTPLSAIIQPPTPARPPNIIFIMADDLGYGDLGCYGQTRIKTPNIDRLADEGVRFTSCYAGSTVCAPSRAALMTGLHTGHVGIRGNSKQALLPEDVTVAEVLKGAGYATAALGKWGLGAEGTSGHPNRQGFDEWFGFLDQTHAHNYYPEYLSRNETRYTLQGNLNGQKGEYVHNYFTRAATNFVRINARRPFFLYLAYTIPHANNELKEQGMQIPIDAPYTQESWPQPEKNKAAMITKLDEDVGKLLDWLKAFRLETNTVVFFTSDNGPHQEGGVNAAFHKSSGPFRGIKRDLYEGGIRVPMIVRWPGRVKPATVSDQVWAFWDFLPTAAEIAGVKSPDSIDGISMTPTLLGHEQKNHEYLYWEFHENGFKQAIRMGQWKAVRLSADGPLELYDLEKDLGETTNVAGEHPDIVTRIEACFKKARTDSAEWPIQKEASPKP